MKTAILFFGRCQPCVHKGHEMIFNKMRKEWLKDPQNSTYFIYLTKTLDKKNPIPYDTKLQVSKQLVPVHASRFVDEHPGNLIAVLKDLQTEYQNVKVFCGPDRVHGLKYIQAYNGKEYNFDSLDVIGVGTRVENADGIEGVSGTKLRECLQNNDIEGFKKGIPETTLYMVPNFFKILSEYIEPHKVK